nr:D-ribose pyranase [uncultured Halomonas sp.]
MKRQGLLNAPISTLLAELGHTDTLIIADAGLPIPPGVPRIDLALRPGLPSFLDVLDAVLDELCIESATLASEIDERNASLHQIIEKRLAAQEHRDSCSIERRLIAHEAFKREIINARGVIRTGECTPFANIILRSGVPF